MTLSYDPNQRMRSGLNDEDCLCLFEINEALAEAQTSAALERVLGNIRTWLDLRELLLAQVSLTASPHPPRIFNSGYDRAWLATYLREHFENVDPVIASIREGQRFFTRGPVMQQGPKPSPWRQGSSSLEQRFAMAARDFRRPVHGYAGGRLRTDILQLFSATAESSYHPARTMLALRGLQLGLMQCMSRISACQASRGCEPLSERERDLLVCLAHGKSDIEIARSLGITVSTVRYHLSNVFYKLEARNRSHAVAKANQLGVLNTRAVDAVGASAGS